PRDDSGNHGNYWELYRILARDNPVECFMSNAALGEPRRGPEVGSDFIYEGISTWETLKAARDIVPRIERGSKRHRTVWGIAELLIPSTATDVFIMNTFSTGHYTVKG